MYIYLSVVYMHVRVPNSAKYPAKVLLVQGRLQLAARGGEIGQSLVDIILDGLPDFGGPDQDANF